MSPRLSVAWWHDVPANLPSGVHVRPALGRLRLVERKHARVVDHDRDLGQRVETRIAKVDKRVELTGAKIGVEAQDPRGAKGQGDLGLHWNKRRSQRYVPEPTASPSIFLSQHDRDDPLGDGWVRWVGRMTGQGFVVVVDLEHDRMPVRIE